MQPNNVTPLGSLGADFVALTERLGKLHITSLENLVLYSRIPGTRGALLAGSGLTETDFNRLVDRAIGQLGSRAESMVPATEQMIRGFRFGIRVTDRMLKRRFEARVHPFRISLTSPLPGSVNHKGQLQPVRSQALRGTCVAFGTVAAAEFEFSEAQRLSEQFVYWAAKMRDDAPDMEGTTVECGFQALKDAGVCPERVWPYNPDIEPGSVHQGPPSAEVRIEARNHCVPAFVDLSLSDLIGLKAVLSGGVFRKPALITAGFLVYDSWFRNRLVLESGELTMPVPGEPVNGGHCMAIVGYSDHPDAARCPGGGYLVVRNSWGPEWAAQSGEGPGYGRVPYAYVTEGHMPEAYAIGVAVGGRAETAPAAAAHDRLSKVRQRLNERAGNR